MLSVYFWALNINIMCRKTFFNLNLVQSVKHVCTVLIMQAGLVPLLKRGTRFSYSSTDVLSEQFKHGILHNITQRWLLRISQQ